MKRYSKAISNLLMEFLNQNQKIDIYSLNQYLKFDRAFGLSFQKTYSLKKNLPGNAIEFRCSNGTLNPTIWQNNINFFIHLLLKCRQKENFDMIEQYLYQYNAREYRLKKYNKIKLDKAFILSDFLFDEELDKKNFIKQYIKDDKNKKITY